MWSCEMYVTLHRGGLGLFFVSWKYLNSSGMKPVHVTCVGFIVKFESSWWSIGLYIEACRWIDGSSISLVVYCSGLHVLLWPRARSSVTWGNRQPSVLVGIFIWGTLVIKQTNLFRRWGGVSYVSVQHRTYVPLFRSHFMFSKLKREL
jgi:hypothetical protein